MEYWVLVTIQIYFLKPGTRFSKEGFQRNLSTTIKMQKTIKKEHSSFTPGDVQTNTLNSAKIQEFEKSWLKKLVARAMQSCITDILFFSTRLRPALDFVLIYHNCNWKFIIKHTPDLTKSLSSFTISQKKEIINATYSTYYFSCLGDKSQMDSTQDKLWSRLACKKITFSIGALEILLKIKQEEN